MFHTSFRSNCVSSVLHLCAGAIAILASASPALAQPTVITVSDSFRLLDAEADGGVQDRKTFDGTGTWDEQVNSAYYDPNDPGLGNSAEAHYDSTITNDGPGATLTLTGALSARQLAGSQAKLESTFTVNQSIIGSVDWWADTKGITEDAVLNVVCEVIDVTNAQTIALWDVLIADVPEEEPFSDGMLILFEPGIEYQVRFWFVMLSVTAEPPAYSQGASDVSATIYLPDK